jgi:hypothetical protein
MREDVEIPTCDGCGHKWFFCKCEPAEVVTVPYRSNPVNEEPAKDVEEAPQNNYCQNCGKKFEHKANYCGECGSKR